MKRVLLDTNIYGRIVDKKEEDKIKELTERRKDTIIYGFDVVRKELRATSKKVRFGKKLVRIALLTLYDSLVEGHIYSTTSVVKQLAEDYYEAYRALGGKQAKSEMMNDFLIVACASLHEMDIVVSDDNNTMLSGQAIKAYHVVNALRKYRIPLFIDYESFGRLLA